MAKNWLIVTAVFFCVLSFVLWAFPKVITGDYADITITKIVVGPDGLVTLDCSIVSSSGTCVEEAFYDGAKYSGRGEGSGGGFLGRPGRGSCVLDFTLNPEATPARGTAEATAWYGRLLVKEGEQKRLRRGERLYFYDFQTADGMRHEGYIKASAPAPRMITVLPSPGGLFR